MSVDAFHQAALWGGGDPEDRWTLQNPANGRRLTIRDRVETWDAIPPEQRMSFEDLLDVVNPLQHIPLVNVAYRELTGDELSAPGRILGGLLYGGPMGMMAGAVEAAYERDTGRDFGGTAVALQNGEDLGRTVTGNAVLAEAVPDIAAPLDGQFPPVAPAPAAVPGGAAPADPAPPQVSHAPAPAAGGSGPLSIDERMDAALMALAGASAPAAVSGASDPRRIEVGRPGTAMAEIRPYAGWPEIGPSVAGNGPAAGSPVAMAAAASAYEAGRRTGQPGSLMPGPQAALGPLADDDDEAGVGLRPGAIGVPY